MKGQRGELTLLAYKTRPERRKAGIGLNFASDSIKKLPFLSFSIAKAVLFHYLMVLLRSQGGGNSKPTYLILLFDLTACFQQAWHMAT